MARIQRYFRTSRGIDAGRVRVLPDITGLARGVDQVAEAVISRETDIREAQERRMRRMDKLRTMNQANKMYNRYRDRYFEMSQITGEDALDMYETETEKVFEDRQVYQESIQGLDPDTANNMLQNFDQISGQYLNRISEHTRSEALRFEQKTMADSAEVATQEAIDSPVGNFSAIEGIADNIRDIYAGFPEDQVIQTDEAILETYRQWTIINPEASIQSYEQNKERLRELMGKGYAKVNSIIQTAIQIRENQAAERKKQQDEWRKNYINDLNNDIMLTIFAAERGDEEAQARMSGIQERIVKDPILPPTGIGGKQWWVTNLQRVRDSIHTRDYTLLSSYYDKAYVGGITEDDRKRLLHNVTIGRTSLEDVNKVLAVNARYVETPDDPVLTSTKEARDTVKKMILDRGMLAKITPVHHFKVAQAQEYIEQELDKQTDINKKLDMLDPLSKNYIVPRAFNKYKLSDMEALQVEVDLMQGKELEVPKREWTEEELDRESGLR